MPLWHWQSGHFWLVGISSSKQSHRHLNFNKYLHHYQLWLLPTMFFVKFWWLVNSSTHFDNLIWLLQIGNNISIGIRTNFLIRWLCFITWICFSWHELWIQYCLTTVDCHDTKAENAGNQLLFCNQLFLIFCHSWHCFNDFINELNSRFFEDYSNE